MEIMLKVALKAPKDYENRVVQKYEKIKMYGVCVMGMGIYQNTDIIGKRGGFCSFGVRIACYIQQP